MILLWLWVIAGGVVAGWLCELLSRAVCRMTLAGWSRWGLVYVGGLLAYTIITKAFPEWL